VIKMLAAVQGQAWNAHHTVNSYADDLVGALLVRRLEQILGHMEATGQRYEAHHLRTSDGQEIDLMLELGGEPWAIETKLLEWLLERLPGPASVT
jgi:hypothetical protein